MQRHEAKLGSFTIGLILLSLSQPALGQGQGRPRAGLDLVVNDTSGHPVPGLTMQDFSLLDNGTPQKLLTFHPQGELVPGGLNPIASSEVTIVIDTENTISDATPGSGDKFTASTGHEYVAYERQQVEIFLHSNGGTLPCPVNLMIYDQNGAKAVAPASRDGISLANALEKAKPTTQVFRQSQGYYGAVERMQLSVKTLAELSVEAGKRPGRKVILWISPGWPLLQSTEAETDAKQSRHLFDGLVTLTTAMRQARISLYAIDPNREPTGNASNWFRYTGYTKPVKRWKEMAPGNMALQVLAEHSGGKAINSTAQELGAQIAQVIAEATQGYIVSFELAQARDKDEYHELKVTVDKPGLEVRARRGYYAQP